MARLEYEYCGIVFTVRKLREMHGLSGTGAQLRLKDVIAGRKPPAYLFKPKESRRDWRENSQQKKALAEFARLTANDDHLIEKYYSPLP